MWILLGWFRTLVINPLSKEVTMGKAASKVPEETKPLPRILRVAAALVFPVLFELRNDPRVKNTPKVKLLFSKLDCDVERDKTTEDTEIEPESKIKKNEDNSKLPMILIEPSTVKKTPIKLRKVKQPPMIRYVHLKTLNNNANSMELNLQISEEFPSELYKEHRGSKEELDIDKETLYHQGEYVRTSEAVSGRDEPYEYESKIPLRFRHPHNYNPPLSQLSSWSSVGADNSLSDLYCDDEFKLSLEFDPNMQLLATLPEEGEVTFPSFINDHAESFLSMSAVTEQSELEQLSMNSWVGKRTANDSYIVDKLSPNNDKRNRLVAEENKENIIHPDCDEYIKSNNNDSSLSSYNESQQAMVEADYTNQSIIYSSSSNNDKQRAFFDENGSEDIIHSNICNYIVNKIDDVPSSSNNTILRSVDEKKESIHKMTTHFNRCDIIQAQETMTTIDITNDDEGCSDTDSEDTSSEDLSPNISPCKKHL